METSILLTKGTTIEEFSIKEANNDFLEVLNARLKIIGENERDYIIQFRKNAVERFWLLGARRSVKCSTNNIKL